MSSQDSPLSGSEQSPVYFTRFVGSRLARVHYETFTRYAVPAAWRLERDGGLSPLYDHAAVAAFEAIYTVVEIVEGAE